MPIEVAIIVCPQAGASTLYGMHDLLAGAGRDWEALMEGGSGDDGPLRPRILSRDGMPLTIANGVVVTPEGRFEDCPHPDVVVVPELAVLPDSVLGRDLLPEIRWLRRWHDSGAIIATACSGTLLLAETGLLDGHPATTHWAFCDALQERHPGIDVQGHRALVVAGEGQRLLMAGAGASWMDMALFLIARLLGVEAAVRTARVNLIDWHDVGQQPFASLARSRQQQDALIGGIQAWIGENYSVSSPVATMAARSGLPERSFDRRFRKATGMSPLAYVQTLRLEEAKQQLEATALPIEAIAGECGYEDAGYFSRLFTKRVGLTPANYRRRFGRLREELARP
ncbi:MAG: helix-turn-helix domain-containing protein [Pseudomonadota bacterium]|nr:helix-turn-helix domain-containing protein [Pseudomonadota bacterium]